MTEHGDPEARARAAAQLVVVALEADAYARARRMAYHVIEAVDELEPQGWSIREVSFLVLWWLVLCPVLAGAAYWWFERLAGWWSQ